LHLQQGKVVASALPRTIVYCAPRRRVAAKPGTSPRALLQEEAQNSQTGRKAVGPWCVCWSSLPLFVGDLHTTLQAFAIVPCAGPPMRNVVLLSPPCRRLGPFASAAPAGEGAATLDAGLIPSTIFMDKTGACHLDLDLDQDRRMVQELDKAQSDSGLLSAAADEAAAKLASQQLELRRDKQQQARAVQSHTLFSHASLDKTPPARDVIRRLHIINQPRRFN
jgi:hypothetical protein